MSVTTCSHPMVNITAGVNTCMLCGSVVDLVEQERQTAERPRWSPPETVYGSRYRETSDMDVAELARCMRADIRAAIRAGALPGTARDYSVRISRYSGGQSIDIDIRNHPEFWGDVPDPWIPSDTVRGLLPAGREAERVCQAIHDAYNYNGSDSQVDYFHVRYYGHAKVDWQSDPGR